MKKSNSMLMFWGILVLTTLLFAAGCGKDISDEDISSQIQAYFKDVECRSSKFGEWFNPSRVVVNDRLKEEKKLVVICSLSVTTIQKFKRDWIISSCFKAITGGRGGNVGDEFTGEFKFRFALYDTGWRIEEWVR